MNLGTDDTHLNEEETFVVRTAADSTFQIHAENLNCIAEGDIFGCEFLLRFLCSSFLSHAFLCFIHMFAQILAFFFHSREIHMVFLEFVEHLHSLVCIFLGFAENCMSFLIGLTDDAVSLLVQLLLLGFHFGFQRGNFLFILFNLAAFIFNSYTAAFQGTENIFERFILFTDLFFGLIDDIVRKSKLGRNGECITFPGNTDQQAVGRVERFHVKFAAGIFYT